MNVADHVYPFIFAGVVDFFHYHRLDGNYDPSQTPYLILSRIDKTLLNMALSRIAGISYQVRLIEELANMLTERRV
jgi:hypothetical protein